MRFHSMHEAFAAVLPFSYYNTGSGSPVSGVHRDPTRWHQGVRCTLHVVLKVWGGRKRRAINNHINCFYCQRDLLCKIKATVLRRLWPWKTIHCWRGLTKGDKRVSETPHLCFKVSKNSVMSPLWPRRAGRGYSGIGVGGGRALNVTTGFSCHGSLVTTDRTLRFELHRGEETRGARRVLEPGSNGSYIHTSFLAGGGTYFEQSSIYPR